MTVSTEKLLLLASIGLYVISSVAFTARLLTHRSFALRLALAAATSGLVTHAAAIGIRWEEAGHGPYINTYEALSSSAWMIAAFFLLARWRMKKLTNLGVAVLPITFLMLGAGLMGTDEIKYLPPTLQSSWLGVHILFAKLTVSALALSTSMAVFYLLKAPRVGSSSAPAWLERLPSLAVLDDFGYRLVAVGFIALTVMIIAGAIWAQASWGDYWSWDPTETWSLVVWLVVGLYLHGRVTFKWEGKVAAWFVVGMFLFSLLAFFVLPYFVKGQHSAYMAG